MLCMLDASCQLITTITAKRAQLTNADIASTRDQPQSLCQLASFYNSRPILFGMRPELGVWLLRSQQINSASKQSLPATLKRLRCQP